MSPQTLFKKVLENFNMWVAFPRNPYNLPLPTLQAQSRRHSQVLPAAGEMTRNQTPKINWRQLEVGRGPKECEQGVGGDE